LSDSARKDRGRLDQRDSNLPRIEGVTAGKRLSLERKVKPSMASATNQSSWKKIRKKGFGTKGGGTANPLKSGARSRAQRSRKKADRIRENRKNTEKKKGKSPDKRSIRLEELKNGKRGSGDFLLGRQQIGDGMEAPQKTGFQIHSKEGRG